MYYWDTEYRIQTHDKLSSAYGSYVLAENELIAQAKIKFRGLGEKIISAPTKRELNSPPIIGRVGANYLKYRARRLPQVLHNLCFTSNAVLPLGLLTPDFFLGDEGIIHELVHEIEYPDEFGFREHVSAKLKEYDSLLSYLGW